MKQYLSRVSLVLAAILTIVCIGSAFPAMTLHAGAATTNSTDAELQFDADQVVALVNQERAAQGLDPLYAVPLMNTAAAVRANECTELFEHTRPDGTSCFTIFTEFGIASHARAENIAYGDSTPEDVVDTWMNSTGHRTNILNSSYSYIGVGVAYTGGTYYWTQIFAGGVEQSDGYLPTYVEPVTTTITTQAPATTTTQAITTAAATAAATAITTNTTTTAATSKKYFYLYDLEMQEGDILEVEFSGDAYADFTASLSPNGGASFYLFSTYLRADGTRTLTYTADQEVDSMTIRVDADTAIDLSGYGVEKHAVTTTAVTTTLTTTTATTTTQEELQVIAAIDTVEISLEELEENDYLVEVPVTLPQNDGFQSMGFGVSWDSDLITIEYASGMIPGFLFSGVFQEEGSFGWVCAAGAGDYTGNAFCTLMVQVDPSVQSGDVIPLQAMIQDASGDASIPFNVAGESLTLAVQSGAISISGESTTTLTQQMTTSATETTVTETTVNLDRYDVAAQISAVQISDTELAASDNLVEVPVTFSRNGGFQNIDFGISWDPDRLTLEEIECSSPDLVLSYVIADSGDLAWCAAISQKTNSYHTLLNYTGTDFCILRFRVTADALPGDVDAIQMVSTSMADSSATASDTAGGQLTLSLQSGEISIVSDTVDTVQYGDVNLDGRIDLTDAVLLNKAVAGSVQLSDPAWENADCMVDNVLNGDDTIVLLRFLVHLIDQLPV